MIPSARSGSNIRGKMVTKSNLIESLGEIDDDALRRDVDRRAKIGRERHLELAAAVPYFQQHAAAALVRVDDLAARVAVAVNELHADEVVQGVLVGLELAGLLVRNLEADEYFLHDL